MAPISQIGVKSVLCPQLSTSVTTAPQGSVDDFYTFRLSDMEQVVIDEYSLPNSLSDATLTFYAGEFESANTRLLGTLGSLDEATEERTFSGIGTGSFYFEVAAESAPANSKYTFDACSTEPGSPDRCQSLGTLRC